MSDTVKKALDLVSGYQDPTAGNKLDSFAWRPLPKVQEQLEGLPEIPSHVENFGAFMDEMSHRALNGQMSPRDLIKAYAITRSSIRRQAIRNKTLREKGGFHLPFDDNTKIRPEGAMAEWLMTPMGQRYLDMAERGKVDEEAVVDAQTKMRPFGFHDSTEGQALPWAAQNLPQRHKEFSSLIADGLSKDPNLPAWRKSSMSLHGIKEAKSGFMGSLLGRGDQPTLDARQVVLQTGLSNDEGTKRMSNVGFAGVDRLAARQAAMNPKLDSGLEPYRQHLTHHAIWDKAGNDVTTHEDLMRAMRGAKDGGRIEKSGGGNFGKGKFGSDVYSLRDHPLGAALLRVAGIDPSHSDEQAHAILSKIEQRRKQIVNPQDIWKINDPVERARQIAMIKKYDVNVAEDKNPTGGYYNVKQGMAPADVSTTIGPIPGVMPKARQKMSWEDALTPHAGGTLIGLGGDRSRLGRLTHINGRELNWPVDLHAGVDYMLEPNAGQVWANAKAHASGLEKMIGKAAEKGPILGAFQPMGPQSVDSSHNMFDAVMAQVETGAIDPKDAAEFDTILRSGAHLGKKDMGKGAMAMENWPGIMNPKEASEFARNLPGTHRAAIMKLIDTARWRDKGFPSVGVTRAAITEPEILSARNNTVGHRMVELDPDEMMRNVRDSGFAHSTYTEPTGGRYLGDVPLLPRQDVFAEHADAMLAKDIKGGHIVNPYAPAGLGRGTYRKMTEEQKPFAPINQSLIDRTAYAESQQGKLGYNTGGAVKAPTEAQKQAGNYQKGHISFQGLPISIENPKGSTRSGKGPDGKAWSVKMPYDYGYIKRTQGADGDHVDVCIGPDHTSDHVFLVDQHDHRTKQFDEHKVMLGYRTKEAAMAAYCSGFSDGKGPERMKAMVRLSMPEFKTWLKKHDTKRPVRGQGHIDRALSMTSVYTVPNDRDAG